MTPLLASVDRFLAHTGDEVVARLGNLARVPNEESAVGEELLLFLLVELFVDEQLSADEPLLHVDECQHRVVLCAPGHGQDRKSTRLNSSHLVISYAVFCLKKKIWSATAGDDA